MAPKSRRSPIAAPARDRKAAGLRMMPPVDECIRAARNLPVLGGLSHGYLKTTVKEAQAALREAIAGGNDVASGRAAMVEAVVRATERLVGADLSPLRTVVNATGVVLHTNLGRAILAEEAIEAIERAAHGAVNLEFDLEGGGRGDRDALIEDDLRALTGAEAATVVNNNAAAVLLALNTLARGREVIVSRGELIEIGGSFRIPDVMERSGARLVETGTTNRTHLRDYERAIGAETALLLKVHPSNYRVVGFTAEVKIGDLVQLGREHQIPVMEDLGSGALIDLDAHGLPHEPVVAERIAAGADLVTFSGDKLLGGPQAGVIVGRSEIVERINANPLKRALRCSKLTIAALSATLRIYRRSAAVEQTIPTLRLLGRSVDELKRIAEKARELVAERLGPGFRVDVVDSTSQVGSGALPTEELPSVALSVKRDGMSADVIARMFRRAVPPVIGRISNDTFQLDLRAIAGPGELAVQFPESQE